MSHHARKIPSALWLKVQHKLSQNTTFHNGRKCHNTWLARKIKSGCCGYALTIIKGQNGVTYFRCKQRLENKSCEGAGTLTKHVLENFIYNEMVQKM
ncbi:MAG TPA: zinc ribbon domain-containing protein [Mobilitalea sp.]|nr:zinc ribbon domain-containing protein [Mobilitalea sp.]